ncbi:unnamed protein product, partial [Choristocarpus tenellus]
KSLEEEQKARVRESPEHSGCLLEGCYGEVGGCCNEGDPSGQIECKCSTGKAEGSIEEMNQFGACGVCLEDGVLRHCCMRYFCKHCYQITGNCPGCYVITTGSTNVWLTNKVTEETGATAEIKDGEECRSCLRQGFQRKCCGEFYCSDCYFSSGHCPSCQKPAERRIQYEKIPRDPGMIPVLLGYLVTLLVCLAMLACVALIVANNNSLPLTVFEQTCYGFFPECIADVKCAEFVGNISDGIAPITEWDVCDDKTTVNKVYGTYCIYDKQVFVYSEKKWGFDFCKGDFLEMYNGVHVFEDTFELWDGVNASSVTMASARWHHVTNGQLSLACGAYAGDGALYFSGANFREAETLDVDARYGGKLVFHMKMGPSVTDASMVTCKPAFGGNVYIYHSFDSGVSWNLLAALETWNYRSEFFRKVEVEVPSGQNSSSVRFKWKQEDFENAFEHWALDDVQILSYFPSGWHNDTGFDALVESEEQILREIKCCLNSEQCDLSKSKQEDIDCSIYKTKTSNMRALMGAELFVVLAGLISLGRSVYSTGEKLVVKGWEQMLPAFLRKKRPKIFMADDPIPGMLDGSFRLEVNSRWRMRFLALTCIPLGICWLYCAALLRDFFLTQDIAILPDYFDITIHLKVHISVLFLLATFSDAYNIFLLARDVICILPVWVPRVDVDLRPSGGWMQLGSEKINLKDIK